MLISWFKYIRSLENHLDLKHGTKFRLWVDVSSSLWKKKLNEIWFYEIPANGESIIPAGIFWKFSKENIDWKEIVRRDLPKIAWYKEIIWTWQQWTWGGGTEEKEKITYRKYEKYPRENVNPFNIEFAYCEIEWRKMLFILDTFEFWVSDSDKIIFSINLLLEIFWEALVVDVDLKKIPEVEEYSRANWKFFPTWEGFDKAFSDVLDKKYKTDKQKWPILARKNFLESLKPKKRIIWTWWFNWYIAYLYSSDFVILESIYYWNAIYIFWNDWEELSKMTKKQVLDWWYEKARIIHSEEYNKLVQEIYKKAL